MTARYAIYYAPADTSDLARFGNTVLRRTAMQSRRPSANDSGPAFADSIRWNALTQVPARYGFHSTIKAPFELTPDATANELLSATEQLCAQFSPIELYGLRVQSTPSSAFITLAQPQPEELNRLAAAAVVDLDDYRAPLMPADIARRRPETLSLRQRRHLQDYGYPHVLDDFNFHMTLSGALVPDDADFIAWLEQIFGEMVPGAAASLDRLAVYRQTSRETAFVRIAEFPFASQDCSRPAFAQRV